MSATGSVPQRGRRHPITLVIEARRMDEAGFDSGQIERIFASRGTPVQQSTIRRWVDPRVERVSRRKSDRSNASRAAQRGQRGLGRRDHTPGFKFGRMQALHDFGVPVTVIGRLMEFDFGDALTDHQVRGALAKGRYPDLGDGRTRAAMVRAPKPRPRRDDPDVQRWISDGVIQA